MCYSLRTSIISYTIGLASAIFAFITRQYVIGALIFAYAQMQLSEALIWHGIDTNNLEQNKFGTSFGKYLLAVHNIAIGLGILASIYFLNGRPFKMTDFIPLITGVAFFLFVVFYYYLPGKYPDVTFPLSYTEKDAGKPPIDICQNPENRLRWTFPHEWYIASYILSLAIMFIWVKPIKSRILFTALFTITLLATFLINPRTVGSVWCFSAAILAPVAVLINYIIIKNISSNEL
jgi:hypothetical protein